MNTKAIPRQKKSSPLVFAIASFFSAPIAAIICLFFGAMLLVLWPVIPFMSYYQRRDELRNAAAKKMDQPG